MRKAVQSIAMVLLISAGAWGSTPAAEGERSTEEELTAIIMAMMNAIGPGDAAVFERYLADDFILVDRDGLGILTKKDVVEGTRPLPDGYWLKLAIDDVQLRDYGDVAVVIYRVIEEEGIFDQEILVHYRSTHVFHRRDGEWKLVVWQYVETQRDAEPTPVDRAIYDEIAGTYRMGNGIRYVVTRRGDRLFGAREGRAEEELIPESDLVYYHPGTEFRKIFVRDGNGRITEMKARRKGTDLRWTRIVE